jgi:nucleotide-binding universal stress UspA family protein
VARRRGALDVALDHDRPLQGVRPLLLGGLAGFGARLGRARARSGVHVGNPSARLVEVAAAEHARLVVLGRRRDAARQRIGEPNVIHRVARRVPSDVLVVPEGAPAPLEHVIAAVDASPSAQRVVTRALALAESREATLTLVHVLSPAHGSYDRLSRHRPLAADGDAPRHATGETAYRDAAYAWLAWLASDATPRVDCRLAVPTGDPAREITEPAGRRGASLVVVGKRGADGAPPGSLGSVARELVARCPVPVLAVECAGNDGGRADP